MEKLCIDVRGFSEEKKKRVQDAFFKLGYEWFICGDNHDHLYENLYTTVDQDGDCNGDLMFGWKLHKSHKPHLITYPELMRKAGMDESDPDVDYEVPKSEMPVFEYTRDIQEVIESYLNLLDLVDDEKAREVIFAQLADLTDLQFKQLGGGV